VATVLAFCALALLPPAARAWNDRAHKRVNSEALAILPEAARSVFRRLGPALIEEAGAPDRWRQDDPDENRRHFADVEAYDRFPFHAFREQFVVRRLGPKPGQIEHGEALWEIERQTLRLAEALRRGRWKEAERAAIAAAHYACDITQPLHTVLNYDGQFSGQQGIHRRFEVEVVNYLIEKWQFRPEAVAAESDLRERIFREFLASYQHRHVVFAADRVAREGRSYPDLVYFRRFAELAGPLAERRLEAAISFVASLWYTAWERAGSPRAR
jgi:hypothetical protein